MTIIRDTTPSPAGLTEIFPILRLLNPGRLALPGIFSAAIGLAGAYYLIAVYGLPLWLGTLVVLLALTPVGIVKWREDRLRYGSTVMLLSIVLVTQGVHTIEHIAQWVQYYVFNLTARQSNGLLSPANAEWVHFIWNWAVLLVVVLLLRGGMRNIFTYLLLAVAIGHTSEHTYLFVRHLLVLRELRVLDVICSAQGLPGIFGRDGWLARSEWTNGTLLGSLPGFTTAMRLDVHFWWNIIELNLLLFAGHTFLKKALPAPAQRQAMAS